MKIVESPALYPGCCAVTRSATGPFVDTERENQYGERVYLRVSWLQEIARDLLDLVPYAMVAAVQTKMDEREEAVQAVAENAIEAEQELAELREAVRYTLINGAVIEDGEPRLRSKPGKRKVELVNG